MTMGITFLTVTGIMWVVMGAVISRAAQKQLNIAFIQGIAGLLVAILILPALFSGQMPIWQVTLSIFIAGFGNYYIFLLMNKAMQTGPNGLVWAMIQSAFTIPFIMGIVLFGVPCSIFRLLGLILLLIATALMGISGQKSNQDKSGAKKSNKWLWYTISGFLMAGLDQACANLPFCDFSNDFGQELDPFTGRKISGNGGYTPAMLLFYQACNMPGVLEE